MNPKLFFTLFVFVSLFCSSSTQSDCGEAYTSASYALSHSKKAFKAHNFDHQKYYAGRALEAMEKTRGLVAECGCDGAMESVEIGVENLEEAMDPVDWKMGRYYTKRAMENTYGVLEQLDICSMDGETSDDEEETDVNYVSESTESQKSTVADQELISFEKNAREHLKQMHEKIKELALVLGCENVELVLEQTSIAMPEEAQFLSIEEAEDYYRAESVKAYQQAVSAIQKCSDKE